MARQKKDHLLAPSDPSKECIDSMDSIPDWRWIFDPLTVSRNAIYVESDMTYEEEVEEYIDYLGGLYYD